MADEHDRNDHATPLHRRDMLAALGIGGAGALMTGAAPLAGAVTPAAENHDLVIRNGRIVDGSGEPSFSGDVAISNGRFVEVGKVSGRGRQEIDAAGKVVSAGWIDSKGQSGRRLRASGHGGSKVEMGLTTLIAGEEGTPVPADKVSGYFSELETNGIAVNFATYYSAGQARQAVMGSRAGAPTAAQLTDMRTLVDEAMRAGVLGLATGLIYPPTSFMSLQELIELTKVVGKYGGVYATHMRDEGEFVLNAIDEAIEIGRSAGTAVHIFHLKAAFAPGWGKLMPEMGRRIDGARAQGLNVFADVYPYTAAGTSLRTTIPNWMFADGAERAKERLRDPEIRKRLKREVEQGNTADWTNFVYNAGGWHNVVLGSANSAEYNKYAGMKITEIAKLLGKHPADAAWDIVLAQEGSPAMAFYFMMSEPDIEMALRFPWTSIGSDAQVRYISRDEGFPHPRTYGTFPRIFSEYVRKRNVLSLEEAVRKMTSLPATNLGLAGRGQIKVGNWADVTIFDFSVIEDKATYAKPIALPLGIRHVLVNGVPIMLDGKRTEERPGKVLRGPGAV